MTAPAISSSAGGKPATPPATTPVAPPLAAPSQASATWQDANQRYLLAAIAVVRETLESHARTRARERATPGDAGTTNEASDTTGAETAARLAQAQARLAEAARAMPAPPALDRLRATFGLSAFETDLLLLCAAAEFDSRVAALCAGPHGEVAHGDHANPTFSLALAALPGAHWSALSPHGPLRRWRLLEVGGGASLTRASLRIEERVLHFLAGLQQADERLVALLEPPRPTGTLPPSYEALARKIATAWSAAPRTQLVAAVQLCGDESAGKRAVATALCQALGLGLSVINAEALPTAPADLWSFAKLWEREAALSGSALLLDCEEVDGTDAARLNAVTRLVERLAGVLLVAVRDRLRGVRRTILTFDVQKPNAEEQRTLWRETLGSAGAGLNGQIDLLVSQFNLGAQTIHVAGADALGRAAADPDSDLWRSVWNACLVQARPRLEDLAQRIEPSAGWDDLVLPEAQRQILREVAVHVRQRTKVYERWGFAGRGSRGLGISALFAGASGTGKTMAAEVLANELHLDLYRIDLSATVSKYIGETEKNLRRIFDAAEDGGAILLFDEADALFGKRSEVKDSHDRYANIEVGYLLQRMEAYRGLAVLTTNLKSSLDTAFLRRIRFVVQFPFPDAAQRAQIWSRVFPASTPTNGLDVKSLAQLNVAGGNIRNIALGAAFLAADADEPVGMPHLLHAARSEYAKLEKQLTEAEIAGWI